LNRLEAKAYLEGLSPEQITELDVVLGLKQDALLELRLDRQWKPRPHQKALWAYLQGGGKRAVAIWHRRAGKDDVALNWACDAAHSRVGEYWHLLPEAAQGRKAIWDAVNSHTGVRRIDQAFPLEMRANTREQEMVIRLKNGSLWRVVGSDNYNSLVGSSPVGVVLSEWALSDPQAWSFLRPILLENGGWAMFITTPRGPNHAKTTLDLAKSDPNWFWEVLPVAKTGVFSDDDLAAELREMQFELGKEEGQAFFDQEYACSFESALRGSYYGPSLTRMQNDGRIGKVLVDRGNLVHTGWDLGKSDSTAIWFIQCVGKERRLIDYHESSGSDLDVYVRVLDEKRREKGWTYGYHFFPHDVAHDQQGNPDGTRVNTLRRLGITPKVVELGNVNDGINATRRLLENTYADEKLCERGLNCLRNYRRIWNDQTKIFSDKPHHDWASHGADALRTFASGFRDPKDKKVRIPLPSFTHDIRDRSTDWMGR
jgi:phage terminase large subunit